MTAAGPSREGVLSAASWGLALLLLPFALLSIAAAAASLSPSPSLDSPRSMFAVLAAAPLLVTAAGSGWVVSLRRAAGRPGSARPALGRLWVSLGVCATAAPLVQAATGEPEWGLTVIGAIGLLLVLLPVAAHRPRAAVHVAVVVTVTLLGTGLVRDIPHGDLQGPPPTTSPGSEPGGAAPTARPTPTAAPPR